MWFLPSLHRPERLAACLAAIRAAGVSTPGIVVVGADDSLPDNLPDGWIAERRDPSDLTVVAVSNRFLADHPGLAWYGAICDDNIVRTPGWDASLVRTAGATGIASSNDLHQAPRRMQGATVWGGDLLRTVGFWSPPFLHHCFVDDFWEEIGRHFKIWCAVMNVVVEHMHPMHGTAKVDPTYLANYREMDLDREAFATWKAGEEYAELMARIGRLLPAEQARMLRAQSRSVMIATPIARHPCWQYMLALTETVLMLQAHGIPHARQFVIGSSNLPRARNELVARFLASSCTDLLFIDDDMGWNPEAVMRLLASDKPFAAVVGRKRVDKPNSDQSVWCGSPDCDASGELVQDGMGFVRFRRVGTGFVKIAREVFERIIEAHPDWKGQGNAGMSEAVRNNYYRFFRFGDHEYETGEDFEFCNAWRDLGGEIWIDPEISLVHVGEKEYSGAICELMQPAEPMLEAAE